MKTLSNLDLQLLITHSNLFTKIKLSASTRLVLRALIDYYNSNTGKLYPSQTTLSAATGCSIRQVERSILELKNNGLIISSGQIGKSNHYKLTNKFYSLILTPKPCKSSKIDDSTPANLAGDPRQFGGQTPDNLAGKHDIKHDIKHGFFKKNFKVDHVAYNGENERYNPDWLNCDSNNDNACPWDSPDMVNMLKKLKIRSY